MNPQDRRTIEQFLEQLGSEQHPGEHGHRYQLRRSLLNSSYFEVHRARVIWERIIAFSGPAFAGGFVVLMVVLAVQVYPNENRVVSVDSELHIVQAEEPSVLPEPEVFDIPNEIPVASFASFMKSEFQPVFTE
jgi:hypothetical protein